MTTFFFNITFTEEKKTLGICQTLHFLTSDTSTRSDATLQPGCAGFKWKGMSGPGSGTEKWGY